MNTIQLTDEEYKGAMDIADAVHSLYQQGRATHSGIWTLGNKKEFKTEADVEADVKKVLDLIKAELIKQGKEVDTRLLGLLSMEYRKGNLDYLNLSPEEKGKVVWEDNKVVEWLMEPTKETHGSFGVFVQRELFRSSVSGFILKAIRDFGDTKQEGK